MSTLERIRRRVTEMATCRDVGRLLQSYIDGELDDRGRAKVTAHLERCLRCRPEADLYARIKRALAGSGQGLLVHPEDRLALERLRHFAAGVATKDASP